MALNNNLTKIETNQYYHTYLNILLSEILLFTFQNKTYRVQTGSKHCSYDIFFIILKTQF